MKILFLSTWFPYPPDNGSKLRVYHLLRSLSTAHGVTLVSFAFDTARPEQASDLRSLCTDVRSVALNPFLVNEAGALRTYLSLHPMASRPIPAMQQLVAAVLRSADYDAVIASTEVTASYALLTSPTTARILEDHNAMTRWARERYADASNPLQRARCWVSWQKSKLHQARFYPSFDLVTMVSDADRKATLGAVGADRLQVEVVPNGVDCSHNRPGLAQAQPYTLIYNGALTYSANYDAMSYFLSAIYPSIRNQIPETSLTITGSLDGVDLSGLALDDSVKLSGYVDDIRPSVAGSSVCVIPLREGGGTRIKILEAMALGTPVISTTKGAEGLEVVDGEHLILADDPADFAARTVDQLTNDGLRRQLAANARRLVEERYDWTEIGAHFVALVEDVASRRRSTDRC